MPAIKKRHIKNGIKMFVKQMHEFEMIIKGKKMRHREQMMIASKKVKSGVRRTDGRL